MIPPIAAEARKKDTWSFFFLLRVVVKSVSDFELAILRAGLTGWLLSVTQPNSCILGDPFAQLERSVTRGARQVTSRHASSSHQAM
jgi:hypothetical protein